MKPPYRCLFNGDCNFLFARDYGAVPGRPYTARVIHDYMDKVAGAGVDAYLINSNGQMPWYPSRAVPGILSGYTRGDRAFALGLFPPLDPTFTQAMLDKALDRQIQMLDRLLDLQEAGVDWFGEAVARCRLRGVSPWASVRMNDAHGANNWDKAYFNCALQRDPRFRLKGQALDPARFPDRLAQVLDFGHPEVRGYYREMIRELVEDYDVDGVELDWLRMPLCGDPPASREFCEEMLEWMAGLRELVRQACRRRGRSGWLGLRAPARLGHLKAVGLDVPEMARRGLIDFVGLSNFWQTTWTVPFHALRGELGPEVALYGGIEAAPNWMFAQAEGLAPKYRMQPESVPLLNGNAAAKWACGADGLEIFNFFCAENPRYDAIRGLADPAGLRGQPKQYALATAFGYYLYSPCEREEGVPAWLEPGGWVTFTMGLAAEPLGTSLTVQVVLDRRSPGAAEAALAVSLNGSWPVPSTGATESLLFPAGSFATHVAEHVAFEFELDAAGIREGLNEVTVYHVSGDTLPRRDKLPAAIRIVGVEAAVRPR